MRYRCAKAAWTSRFRQVEVTWGIGQLRVYGSRMGSPRAMWQRFDAKRFPHATFDPKRSRNDSFFWSRGGFTVLRGYNAHVGGRYWAVSVPQWIAIVLGVALSLAVVLASLRVLSLPPFRGY